MDQKLKILIFSLAYHPFIGGAEVAIKEITDRLGDSFDFDMITVNLDGKQKDYEKIGNVNVYRIGSGKLSKYLFPWIGFKKAKELHKQNNYNLIWAMMANQAGWVALKFKKTFPEVKYLLTLQEGDSNLDIWVRTFLIRPIYKAIYKKADHIQAISSYLADRAKDFKVTCPITIIPNGVKVYNIDNIKADRSIPIIVTVSRLVKKNGVSFLIKAMQNIDGKLIIIGDGYLRKKLERLVEKLKLKDKVEFKGQISNELVYEYLKQADVFCRPSLSEGLGNVFLEAMSCQIPVVATPVGGIVDFLKEGETGWFCKVKDSQSIAEKINYIFDDNNSEEIRKIKEQAFSMVSKQYNWDSISSDFYNLCINLIGTNKIKPSFKEGKLKSGIVYPEIFKILPTETVLNVGCGDGVQALIYKNNYQSMVGVDIDKPSLDLAKQVANYYDIPNLSLIEANVENIPLESKFDKVLAIDIIEHVINPEKVLSEIKRLLKDNGSLLITFPAMHDKWEDFFRFVGRKILRRKGKTVYREGWDPREHQYDYSVKQWLEIMDQAGYELVESRASTMFPPLHYLGFPRFWFSNRIIHVLDRFFCKVPILKKYGQAMVCVYKKL